MANNETGVIQPVAEVAEFARSHGLAVHTDAVQAAGRIPIDFASLGVDTLALSAHKFGGPKGVGALVIRDHLDLVPLLRGGGQERRRRAGTENLAAIAGFGAAAAAALAELDKAAAVAALRDALEAQIRSISPRAIIVGETAPRLCNTIGLGASRQARGDARDQARPRRNCGECRFGMLVGQSRRQSCARGDGRRT